MKLKIIILCNSLRGGGAEKVAAETFSILKKSSNLAVLVACCDNNSDIKLRKSKEKNIFTSFFNFINFWIFLKSLIKEQPDVIHIHNYVTDLTFSVLFSIRLYRLFYPVRVIQTLHDHHLTCPNSSLYNDNRNLRCMDCINSSKFNIVKNRCYQGSLLKSLFKYFRFFFIRIFASNRKVIDLFLCPSQFIQDIVIKDGISRSRTSILRNPISELFTESSCPNKIKPKASNVNMLFLGRLVKIKSVETTTPSNTQSAEAALHRSGKMLISAPEYLTL